MSPSSSSHSNRSRSSAKNGSTYSSKPAQKTAKVNQHNGINQKICEICGAKARGPFHGVTACPACWMFYQRHAGEEFECSFSKNCDITVLTRNECQFCRLQKKQNLILRNQTRHNPSSSSAPKMIGRNQTQNDPSSSSDSQFDHYARLLMAPLEDGVVLDTKSLCDSISREMKARKITQKV